MAQLTDKQLDLLEYKADATVVVDGVEFDGSISDVDNKHGRVTIEFE